MHFLFKGPIVSQLFDLFCKDWFISTGEMPLLKPHKPYKPTSDDKPCRVISDGPDEDINKLSLILHSAICAANKTVLIMTPYFIPSREMIAIMLAAANRGIIIKIILPEKSNLPYVDAATRNLLWELLEWNISIFYQPPPFEHGKLIIIDECYVLIGSANIDPRSLRLNFELMVEIIDKKFAQEMAAEANQIIEKSRQITFQEVESRSMPTRIKDSLCWLFSPYL
jgi:cardiolipin synthase